MKPGDVELTLIYAQASLDQGKAEDAATALARAEGAGQGDWRLLSIIGVTMDSLDQHTAGAGLLQARARALAGQSENPLQSRPLLCAGRQGRACAEETLRYAIALPGADARVKHNLMLVLGVQGKFDEAEKVAGPETPKALVESNRTISGPCSARRGPGTRCAAARTDLIAAPGKRSRRLCPGVHPALHEVSRQLARSRYSSRARTQGV